MSENAKKIGIGAFVAMVLVIAIFEGFNFFRGPTLNVIKGPTFQKGHGMKAALQALMKKHPSDAPAKDASTKPSTP